MEFIEGESLAERIRLGALPAQEAAQIVLAILCEAPRTSCFLPRAPSFSTSESLSMFRCLWRKIPPRRFPTSPIPERFLARRGTPLRNSFGATRSMHAPTSFPWG